jgi:hypothetical protein
MNRPRITKASTMPISSTRCWWTAGTPKADMMITKMNRLSTDSEYSVRYPAKYWTAKSPLVKNHTPSPNATAQAM